MATLAADPAVGRMAALAADPAVGRMAVLAAVQTVGRMAALADSRKVPRGICGIMGFFLAFINAKRRIFLH